MVRFGQFNICRKDAEAQNIHNKPRWLDYTPCACHAALQPLNTWKPCSSKTVIRYYIVNAVTCIIAYASIAKEHDR